ncbi:MAG TPA: cellulase family glycosylhydrolase [Chloroflexia bacterium]|nr:cellulase family glycosylhydrolase [Chloroflexia bacterium]
MSLLTLLDWGRSPRAQAQIDIGEYHFEETGYVVRGQFLDYWEERGGLFSYGYPISEQFEEDGWQVQYFERARFELHPENAGSEYEVLLGHLGRQLTSRRNFAPLASEPAELAEGTTYFPETRHTLGGPFLDYWSAQGGLARFGYPISEELSEVNQGDRHTYVVQYFERARFEYHPENDEPYTVLLGHLGKEALSLRRNAGKYVQVLDGQLVAGKELRPLKLKGFNYFPRDYSWTHFGDWPAKRVDFELAKAQELGTNTLRVFIRRDAFGGEAAAWGKQEGFGELVRQARARGMYLIVGLFDSFRKWPDAGWDNWPAEGTLEEADDITYLRAIVPLWKDEPTILAWDVYNEPDFVSQTEYQWDAHRANRLDWLSRMAGEVRRLDSNHLVTIGVALSSSNFQAAWDGSAPVVADMVDFVSVHYYLRNYPGRDLVAVLNELKGRTRKPLVVEEAGHPTSAGFGDDAVQARFMADVIRDVRATDISGLLVWTLYDFPQHVGNSEGHYGLFRADDSAKPAVEAFKHGF